MASSKSEVAKLVSEEEAIAIYTHCYIYTLNSVCADTTKRCKIMKDAFDTLHA